MRPFTLIGILSLMSLSQLSPAQDVPQPVISTDRPSIGTGTDLAPAHHMVAENGLGLSFGSGSTTFDGAENLLRFGINSRVELRTLLPSMQYTTGTTSMQRHDAAFGAKLRLPAPSTWPVSAVVGAGFSFSVGR
jgi:hypothetical protein